MSKTNIRAIVLKINNDHGIACPTTVENQIVSEIEKLWQDNNLAQPAVQNVTARLPARFFAENKLDSANQYGRMLWDALKTSEISKAAISSETHFHAPVTQTGIFQT